VRKQDRKQTPKQAREVRQAGRKMEKEDGMAFDYRQLRIDEAVRTSMEEGTGASATRNAPMAQVIHHYDGDQEAQVAVKVAGSEFEENHLQERRGDAEEEVRTGTSSSQVIIVLEESASLTVAYCLCLTLGWIGAHQFYLGRFRWGLLYLCTFGMLGWGVLIDLLRMPSLLRQRRLNLAVHEHNDFFRDQKTVVGDAYVCWIFGFLGLHRFFMKHYRQGCFYTISLGLFGMFALDLFRIPFIAGKDLKEPTVVEAYQFLIPGGIFGLHRFYLRDYGHGFLYLFTLGIFGLGFVADIFQLPFLVRHAKENAFG